LADQLTVSAAALFILFCFTTQELKPAAICMRLAFFLATSSVIPGVVAALPSSTFFGSLKISLLLLVLLYVTLTRYSTLSSQRLLIHEPRPRRVASSLVQPPNVKMPLADSKSAYHRRRSPPRRKASKPWRQTGMEDNRVKRIRNFIPNHNFVPGLASAKRSGQNHEDVHVVNERRCRQDRRVLYESAYSGRGSPSNPPQHNYGPYEHSDTLSTHGRYYVRMAYPKSTPVKETKPPKIVQRKGKRDVSTEGNSCFEDVFECQPDDRNHRRPDVSFFPRGRRREERKCSRPSCFQSDQRRHGGTTGVQVHVTRPPHSVSGNAARERFRAHGRRLALRALCPCSCHYGDVDGAHAGLRQRRESAERHLPCQDSGAEPHSPISSTPMTFLPPARWCLAPASSPEALAEQRREKDCNQAPIGLATVPALVSFIWICALAASFSAALLRVSDAMGWIWLSRFMRLARCQLLHLHVI